MSQIYATVLCLLGLMYWVSSSWNVGGIWHHPRRWGQNVMQWGWLRDRDVLTDTVAGQCYYHHD